MLFGMDCLVQEVHVTRDVLVRNSMEGSGDLQRWVLGGVLLYAITGEAPALNRTGRRPAHDILELA
jgi:hypothetical protein